jgi:TfoX C-terminal domain
MGLMTDLQSVVNIGPELARDLHGVGVEDLESLQELGAVAACRLLEANGMHDCTHALLALHGAIDGKRWFGLDPQTKESLKAEWERRSS